MPAPAITAAVSSANTSLLRRASKPITTPRAGSVACGVEQVAGQTGGGAPHDHAVHAERSGTQLAAQAGGPELEPAREPQRQLVGTARQQLLQLRSGVGVGVVGQPRLGGGPRVGRHPCILPHRHRGQRPDGRAPQAPSSSASRRSERQRSGAHVGDHLGGGERPESPAVGQPQPVGEPVQEAGGVEVAGARGVDHLVDGMGVDDVELVARDDHRPGLAPRDGGDPSQARPTWR